MAIGDLLKQGTDMAGGLAGQLPALLSGLAFPKMKNEIADFLRGKGVPDFIVKKIEGMADRKYESKEDVIQEVGKTSP